MNLDIITKVCNNLNKKDSNIGILLKELESRVQQKPLRSSTKLSHGEIQKPLRSNPKLSYGEIQKQLQKQENIRITKYLLKLGGILLLILLISKLIG